MGELPFPSEAFAEAWADWQQHRKEKKVPLTPVAVRNQFIILKEMGEKNAIAALRHSMACGYQGVFAPNKPLTPARAPLERPMAGRVDAPRPRGDATDEAYLKAALALREWKKAIK